MFNTVTTISYEDHLCNVIDFRFENFSRIMNVVCNYSIVLLFIMLYTGRWTKEHLFGIIWNLYEFTLTVIGLIKSVQNKRC